MEQTYNGKNPLNSLKLKNQRAVLEHIRRASPITIADIAERTGLSKVTVMKILDRYRLAGLVTAAKAATNEERGKPANFYTLNPRYKYMYCVKIDGYNMLATLTDLGGKIFASHTTLYNQGIELGQLIDTIADAYAMLLQREDLDAGDCIAIGAGLHGVIDPESGVCALSPQFPNWGHDIPMRELLSEKFPGLPIHVDNWVHFWGQGEATAMRTPPPRFVLISSEIEGINGALMADGKLYRGHDGLAGEIGHMIVDTAPDAEICQCGGAGCFEAAVSPRRMATRLGLPTTDIRKIAEAADKGQSAARKEMERSARFFAIAIRNLMQSFNPSLVIIQGEYANAGTYFLETLKTKIPQTSLLRLNTTVQLEYSTLGQYGAIQGAANYLADIFFATI